MSMELPRFEIPKGRIYIYNGTTELVADERRGDCTYFDERHGERKRRGFNDRQLAKLFHDGALVARPVNAGTLTPEQVVEKQRLALDTLDPKDQAVARRRLDYVRLHNRLARGEKSGAPLEAALQELARSIGDRNPPNARTVLRWSKLLTEADGDARVLVGRRPFKPERRKRVHPLVHKIMKQVIGRHYLDPREISAESAYGILAKALEAEQRRRPEIADQLTSPSLSTFFRAIRKVPLFTKISRRQGEQAAYRQLVIKQRGVRARRPLELVECDSTVADVLWVDRYGHLRKRLTFTLVIDVYSRMVLGFYLGPAEPSWLTVAEAIRNAMAPKIYVRQLYPDIQTPWPCCGTFERIKFDQGSEHNNATTPVVLGTLGTDVIFAPGGWPEVKGIVERFFKTNNHILHSLPGTTRSNPMDRRKAERGKATAEAEALQARYSLEDLRQLFHEFILDIYHNRKHEDLGEASPLQRWQEGVQKFPVKPPPSAEQLAILLGKSAERSLQHYGIRKFELIYRAPELSRLRPEKGNVKVKIKWDPGDISCIWVLDPITRTYIRAVPDKEFEVYVRHLSEAQHRRIVEEAREYYRKGRPTLEQLLRRQGEIIRRFMERVKGNRVKRGPAMDPHVWMPWGSGGSQPVPEPDPAAEPQPLFDDGRWNSASDDGSWQEDVLAVKLRDIDGALADEKKAKAHEKVIDDCDLDDLDDLDDGGTAGPDDEPVVKAAAEPPADPKSEPRRNRKNRSRRRRGAKPSQRPAEQSTPQARRSVADPARLPAVPDHDDAEIDAIAAEMEIRRQS